MNKRTTLILVTALVLLTACGNTRQFDSATWLKANARERGRMSQHLVDSRALVGKSIEHAKQTLGEPQKDWGRVIQYDIDLGWPLKDPKHYGLQVRVDGQQIVREVRIVD